MRKLIMYPSSGWWTKHSTDYNVLYRMVRGRQRALRDWVHCMCFRYIVFIYGISVENILLRRRWIFDIYSGRQSYDRAIDEITNARFSLRGTQSSDALHVYINWIFGFMSLSPAEKKSLHVVHLSLVCGGFCKDMHGIRAQMAATTTTVHTVSHFVPL